MINFIEGWPVLILLLATIALMIVPLLVYLKLVSKPKGPVLYISASVPPLLWLLTPFILAETMRPRADPWSALYDALRFRTEDWFMLPLGLLFLVYAVYVIRGLENDQVHKDIFKPRKLVWFVFGLVTLFVVWFVPHTLLKARTKFEGMHVNLTFDIGEAIEDIYIDAANLNYRNDLASAELQKALRNSANRRDTLVEQTIALESSLALLQASISADSKLPVKVSEAANKLAAIVAEIKAQDMSKASAPRLADMLADASATAKNAQGTVRRLTLIAAAAGVEDVAHKAEALQQQLEKKVLPAIDTAHQHLDAVGKANHADVSPTVQAAQQALTVLQHTVGTVGAPGQGSVAGDAAILATMRLGIWQNSGLDSQARENIQRTIDQMLVLADDIKDHADKLDFTNTEPTHAWRINEIQDKAHALGLAVAAFRFDIGTPMLMVALLFIVFLLMPWLLYISFIVRKRDQIVNDRLELLHDLNLLERFRTVSKLSRDLTIEGANLARELVLSEEDIDVKIERINNLNRYSETSLAFKKVEELKIRTLTESDKEDIIRLADTEILNRQTFHSREYLVPLIILTMLTLVGWYYTIFATGINGLVSFIEQGGGSAQLTNLLAKFTPFTMVFLGAWLYMMVMLTYRWVNNDLHPRSYFYASMRLVYGLLVGMVFLALFRGNAHWYGLVFAFFVGTAPLEFVNALWKTFKDTGSWVKDNWINKQHANQIAKFFERPEWASRQPLTVLDDITEWDNARFYLEGIQNVHALATADLARLAIRTPYDAQMLVDWVDQALLRLHTKVLWHAGMAAIGIRKATDLFDVVGVDEHGICRDEKLTCVVDAFNAAQLMNIDTDDPRFEAHTEAAALQAASQVLAEKAQSVKDTSAKLDLTQPRVQDNIIALRSHIDGLKTFADAATQARQQAHRVLANLNVMEDVAAPWADGGGVDKQLKKLTGGSSSLITKTADAIKEDKLTRKMLQVDLAKPANADKPSHTALQAVQEMVKSLVDPADQAKKASEATAPQLTKIKSAVEPVKEKLAAIREKTKTLTEALIDKTATAQTQAEGLTQANTGELAKRLDEALAASCEAETAVVELSEVLEACGDHFKPLKDRATALIKALGSDVDQLQAKIKAAKDEVDKVANDTNAIAAAKAAVGNVAAAVGTAKSTGNNVIAKQMNSIVEPLQDLELKLEKATTTVADLVAAIARANTLAQSILKNDAATWDKVKALASALSKLSTAVQSTEKARSCLVTKLKGMDAQLTLREAQKKVSQLATEDTAGKVETAGKAFKDEANNVCLSADSSKSELTEAVKKVGPAVTAAKMLASNADAAAEESMRTVLRMRLTKKILRVMLGAMKHDPNIHYIRHYWEKQVDKVKPAA